MEPVNLQPTNYCTAMWNGVRCDGTHDQEWGGDDVIHSVRGERGPSMWRDGYGGIVLNERPYIEDPDIDLGWSALERMHAARDGEGPIVRMSKSRAIAYAGQLAGIGTWGLLGTFETNADWTFDPQLTATQIATIYGVPAEKIGGSGIDSLTDNQVIG